MADFNFNEPHILVRSNRGTDVIRMSDEMLENREIDLLGEINDESVNSAIRQIRHLVKLDPAAPISVFINSPGGTISSGLALYDVMVGCSCPIHTVCVGTAASMGSVLFEAGDTRDILPHSTIMIHDPLIRSLSGNTLEIKRQSDELARLKEIIGKILAERSGHTLEEIYEKTEAETQFTAEEAVAFGLADKIVDYI